MPLTPRRGDKPPPGGVVVVKLSHGRCPGELLEYLWRTRSNLKAGWWEVKQTVESRGRGTVVPLKL